MTTQTIPIELTRPGPLPMLYATAGDIYSRKVTLQLYDGGAPYTPPVGTTCLIGWRRPDGIAGNYDTITEADGEGTHNAWQLEGSTLTFELSDKVCAQEGDTAVNVALIGTDGSRLHTWELVCRVERGAVADSDHGYQPSETATEAADRAEKAAQAAEATLGQVQTSISKATEAATQEAKAAAQQAEDALGQVQSRISTRPPLRQLRPRSRPLHRPRQRRAMLKHPPGGRRQPPKSWRKPSKTGPWYRSTARPAPLP